jgi:hypothetical protein
MGARIHFESAHTAIPSNNITGNGTINQVAKFTGANVIGDGLITDNGTSVWNTGGGSIISNTAFGATLQEVVILLMEFFHYIPTQQGLVTPLMEFIHYIPTQ